MFAKSRLNQSHTLKALVLTAMVLPATACMTTRGARALDAKFAAGWRPSKGYCGTGGQPSWVALASR